MPDRPNIIVILTDDHGQWALGCYGNREVRSPAIDRLASSGVRAGEAYCVTPVCSPARATFHTGLMPSQHGIHDYLREAEPAINDAYDVLSLPTIGGLLSGAGYHCAFAGKWHCGKPERPQPGYADWFALWQETGPHRSGTYSDNGRKVEVRGYKTDVIATRAIEQIRARDAGRPYFGFVGFIATHSPWKHQPTRLVESYRNCTFANIPPDDVIYPDQPGRRRRRGSEGQLWPTDSGWRTNYYAAVTHIDEQVARIVDELEAQGMLDDTLIVYTSDHGLLAGHHGMWGKGNSSRPYNMLDASIRIPMVFGGHRSLARGGTIDAFVDHADLFQTLLELGETAPPDDLRYPGRSFAPALRGEPVPGHWKEIQIGEYGDLRMARTRTHKLIRRHGRGADELYDLANDPRETTSAIDEPAHAEVMRTLDAALVAHFARFSDPDRSGLNVANRPAHNPVEAWRGDPIEVTRQQE